MVIILVLHISAPSLSPDLLYFLKVACSTNVYVDPSSAHINDKSNNEIMYRQILHNTNHPTSFRCKCFQQINCAIDPNNWHTNT